MANEGSEVSPWLHYCRALISTMIFVVIMVDVCTESSQIFLHLLIILIGIVGVKRLKRYCVSRLRHGSARYGQSMAAGFQQTVKGVASHIHRDGGEPCTKKPESGVFQVDIRETAISDRKTSTLLHGGLEKRSVLTVQVTPDVESGGWSVQGTRTTTGKQGFYVISEGFIAPSGKAYWVETGNSESILVSGDYQGDVFSGEWLSSNGDRGRYSDFRRENVVEADTAIVLSNNEVFERSDATGISQSVEVPLLRVV